MSGLRSSLLVRNILCSVMAGQCHDRAWLVSHFDNNGWLHRRLRRSGVEHLTVGAFIYHSANDESLRNCSTSLCCTLYLHEIIPTPYAQPIVLAGNTLPVLLSRYFLFSMHLRPSRCNTRTSQRNPSPPNLLFHFGDVYASLLLPRFANYDANKGDRHDARRATNEPLCPRRNRHELWLHARAWAYKSVLEASR